MFVLMWLKEITFRLDLLPKVVPENISCSKHLQKNATRRSERILNFGFYDKIRKS